jgi:peptidoglycan hydrolase CwlO-like protein
MPKINTYGDAVADAQRLLAAMNENAAMLPSLDTERSELESMLVKVQEAKSRQDFHDSERQRATQDLLVAIGRYKEAAIQVRATARGALGVRNAKLAQFRVAPLRRRKSRTAPAPTIATIKTPAEPAAPPVAEPAPLPAAPAPAGPKPNP